MDEFDGFDEFDGLLPSEKPWRGRPAAIQYSSLQAPLSLASSSSITDVVGGSVS